MRGQPLRVTCTCLIMATVLTVGGKKALADESANDPLEAAGLRLAVPLQQGHLTIHPVVSIQPRQADPYITLQEGLSTGIVKVKEMGSGSGNTAANSPANESAAQQVDINDLLGAASSHRSAADGNQVNLVRVANNGEKPLYLMPGEIILGGDQDRAIAEEYVIKPDGKPVEVKVFCVEHGRWGNRSQHDNLQSLAAVISNIGDGAPISAISMQAAKADRDEFIASANVGNKSVRIAVQQHAKQSKVWEEVAKLNAKSGAMSGSGTYTANFTAHDVNKKLQPYREAFRDPIANVPNIVGVVVEINGRAEAADVFATTPLFKKLWPRLLEGYAVDAATSAPVPVANHNHQTIDSERKEVAINTGSARDFLIRVVSGRRSHAGGGAHARAKNVIALPSEQSYVDAFDTRVPVHIVGYSSDSDRASPVVEETPTPAPPGRQ